MADEPPPKIKLALKKTDTSQVEKADTGSHGVGEGAGSKLPLKKTDTSRVNKTATDRVKKRVAPPAAAASKPTDTPRKKLELALRKTDTSQIGKADTGGATEKPVADTGSHGVGEGAGSKLPLKKTDTSRVNKTATDRVKKREAPPAAAASKPAGTPRKKLELALRKTDTSRLRKTDTGRVKKPEPELGPPGVPSLDEVPADDTTIANPMKLRETTTSRLRRVQPEIESTAAALAPATGDDRKASETVRLKVVREKKKELVDLLTASQTVKIRPSTLEATKPASPAAVAPQAADSGVETRVSRPAPARPPVKPPSASTVKVELPQTAAPPLQAAATPPTPPLAEAPTTPPPALTPKPDGAAAATVKISAPAAQAVLSPATAPTIDSAATPKKGSKLTLKVKPGSHASRTIKLPGVAGASAAATTTVPEVPPASAKTVPVAPPPVPGSPTEETQGRELETSEMPGVTAISEMESPEAAAKIATATEAGDEPGVLLTAVSVAAALALIAAAWFTTIQYLKQCL